MAGPKRPQDRIALTDIKGRRVIVPGAKVAYIEIGTGVAGTVGFRG